MHMFKTIQGPDENDSNCIDFTQLKPGIYRDPAMSRVVDESILNFTDSNDSHIDLKGLKIGIVEEF